MDTVIEIGWDIVQVIAPEDDGRTMVRVSTEGTLGILKAETI
jgi:hypothetical protein